LEFFEGKKKNKERVGRLARVGADRERKQNITEHAKVSPSHLDSPREGNPVNFLLLTQKGNQRIEEGECWCRFVPTRMTGGLL
jgi:hypothetical protein